MTRRLALYASVGAALTHYEVDAGEGTLVRRATVRLPAMVQYVWPHASRRFLYIASSTRGPGMGGNEHHVSAWRIDPASGALSPHGEPVALRTRPIHLTADAASRHLLIAYSEPSALSVHRLGADGRIGEEVGQAQAPDAGIYAHQVRVVPSGRLAIVVARGHDPEDGRPEEPGALKVFDCADGRVRLRRTVAPGGGYGFGPRHLDFHPDGRWVCVSLERQNRLMVFALDEDGPAARPLCDVPTLRTERRPGTRQIAGTVRVHPNGRTVYVANRAYGYVERDGRRVATGGQNDLAVFDFDPSTGDARRVQNAETRGFGVRTFSIDPDATLLIAGNVMPLAVEGPAGLSEVPASLVLYRIGADGRLCFLRGYDVDVPGTESQFWTGMVELPEA